MEIQLTKDAIQLLEHIAERDGIILSLSEIEHIIEAALIKVTLEEYK